MIFSAASLIQSLFAPKNSKLSRRNRRTKGYQSRQLNRAPQSGWIVSPRAENLEERLLLSSITLTAGSLAYTSSSANTLTVTFDNKSDVDPSNDVYHFADTETITATGTGVTGSGTMMVDVATTDVTSVSIDMGKTGFTTIGGLTLSGDLTVTAKTVTLNNGTVSSDTTVTINADGAVTNANADPALVAIAALDLVIMTTGTGSAVGAMLNPITTSLGSLTATTNDGGVFISDFNSDVEDSGLIISNVLVKEKGFTPFVNGSNQVVVKASDSDANPGAGTFDVVVTAEGHIVLNTVTAPDAVTIDAGGMILDANQVTANLLGRTVSLVAGESIGQQPDPIEVSAETVSAATTGSGSIYLTESIVGTLSSIVAMGQGQVIEVTSSASTLKLGTLTALGDVTVSNNGGSILDANGATLNITGANVSLSGKGGIGKSSDPIETTATEIVAIAKDAAAVIFITETDGLSSVTASTKDGNVAINFASGGHLTFTASTDLLDASGAAISFETTGGDVKLGVVDAGTADISITALAAIKDDNNVSTTDLIGAKVTLTAQMGVGALDNEIDTNVDSLTVTAGGGIFIRETNALSLSASTASGDVDVRNSTGDLKVKTVKSEGSSAGGSQSAAPRGNVTLQAGGAIVDDNSGAVNFTGNVLNLTATAGIGTLGDAIETSVSSLTAVGGTGGGVFLSNKQTLTVTSATAAGGNVSVTTTGDLTLGLADAGANSVTVSATGAVIDGNADSLNIVAGVSATINGSRIGASNNKVETSAPKITASSSNGGLSLSNTGVASLALSATALGDGADLDIDSTGSIVLDVAIAKGDAVKLAAKGVVGGALGAIIDGNDTVTPRILKLNISAKSLDISAPGGIGLDNLLELSVDQILGLDGGDTETEVSNEGAVAVSETALEGNGTGNLVISAADVTILDIEDNHADVASNRSLIIKSKTGHVVFVDPSDTIEAHGTGSITIVAGSNVGSGGCAVIGNLKTEGQNISVTADKTITIGLLDASEVGEDGGNVTVVSRAGVIVDGNGAEINIIGHDAIVSGVTPSLRAAEFDEITKVADAAGKRGEAAAKQTSFEAFSAALVITQAGLDIAQSDLDSTTIEDDAANARTSAQEKIVDDKGKVINDLGIAIVALTIAADIAGGIAAAGQAIPLVGDGGTAAIEQVLKVAIDALAITQIVLSVELYNDSLKLNVLSGISEGLDHDVSQLQAEVNADTVTRDALQEAVSITEAASIKAAIARDAAARISEQSTLARDQNNVMSTPDQPLGIRVTGIATLTAPNGDILLEVFGSATINAGSLVLSGGIPDAITLANSGVKFTLTTNETIGSLAGVTGSNVILGSNTLTTGRNNTNTTYAGVISGTGALTKQGTGAFTLTAAETYTGATTVSGGRLNVNGSTTVESVVTVQNTATLGGTGTVAGTTNVQNGGTVSPGTSPGILHTATVTFQSGATFALDIAGTTPGNGATNHDQLAVTGNNRTTTLGGAELVFNLTAAPRVGSGQVYKIIDSTGTGSTVSGTFKYHGFTLNQGDVFTVDSTIFRINYNPSGATGDVILTEIPTETTAILANGTLTITDAGRVSNDNLTLSLDTLGNVLFHDPKNGIAGAGGVMSERVSLASLTRIVVNTGRGSDSLTIDFTNGNPLPSGGLVYNAGIIGGADFLLLNNLGIPFGSVTYQPIGIDSTLLLLAPKSPSGSQPIPLTLTEVSNVTLDGIEAAGLIFEMSAKNDSVALTDLTGAAGVGKESFTGSGVQRLDFSVAGITGLTINGNIGNDSLKVNSLDPTFNAGITLNGGDGNDTLDATGSKKTVGTVTTGVNTFQSGGNNDDRLTGGIGNDTLDGGSGNDIIKGSDGNDAILGGAGNDQLFGDAGNDTVAGGADNDSILGGAGNDVLAGQAGVDTVKGEAGSDKIAGGSGLGADPGDIVTDLAIDIRESLVLIFNNNSKLFEIMGV